MKTSFNSFFVHQKTINYKPKISLIIAPQKLVHVPLNAIFDSYLFVERLIKNKNTTSILNTHQYNIYYHCITSISNVRFISQSKLILDTFTLYFSIVLRYLSIIKSVVPLNAKLIEVSPAVFFFRYYSKAFTGELTNSKSVYLSLQSSKYARLSYQVKLQAIRQGQFFTINNYAFFTKVFKLSNLNPQVSNRKRLSIKRYSYLANKFKRRSRDVIPMTSNLESTNQSQFSRRRAYYEFKRQISAYKKSKVITMPFFPRLSRYRYTKQIKKLKTFKKKISKDKLVKNYKTVNAFYKPVSANELQFKLYPSSYKISDLNTDKFSQFKSLISIVITSQFSFYQINALSLSRYAFDSSIKNAQKVGGLRKKLKFSSKFLESYERELISRFRGAGLYFKDRVRMSFIAIYLKKAECLATFFAQSLSKLPRSHKELKYVRFLIQVLKIAASQNTSILGVRIRFQGRLNRWRRTKHILGFKGNIGYFTYQNRIEYGVAQAITRKGTLGVHIWISYLIGSSVKFANSIIDYIRLN